LRKVGCHAHASRGHVKYTKKHNMATQAWPWHPNLRLSATETN
jgi:hypothetical protein